MGKSEMVIAINELIKEVKQDEKRFNKYKNLSHRYGVLTTKLNPIVKVNSRTTPNEMVDILNVLTITLLEDI